MCLLEVKVDVAEKVITLPKLLLWYNSDFGGGAGETAVLRTISPMMTPTTNITTSLTTTTIAIAASTLAGLLADDQAQLLLSEFKVKYSNYDWSLNESR